MALQMQETPIVDLAQFGRLDRAKRICAGEKRVDHVGASRVAEMDRNTILPVAAIDLEEAIHDRRPFTHQRSGDVSAFRFNRRYRGGRPTPTPPPCPRRPRGGPASR